MSNFVFFFLKGDWAKKSKTLKFLLILLFAPPVLSHAQIKIYNPGQAFTCIAVDSNYNIWAGTSKAGLYLLNKKYDPTAKQFAIASSGNLNTVNIQSLAADQNKQIWVGHNGSGGSFSGGGGVAQVDINNPATIKNFSPDRNAACLSFQQRDGIATLNSASITVDKNGTIWSAHNYHELYVPGCCGSPDKYTITPGSFSYKSAADEKFISKGTFKDYINNTEPPELPYPTYNSNCKSTRPGPPTRNCYAVSCGNNEAWVSVDAYEAKNGKAFPARLLKYDLSGKFIKE